MARSKKVYVAETANLGKGLFAGDDIKKGETIIEFKGNLFTYDEQAALCLIEDYYVQISGNLFMGPSGGMDDYINHSCEPNAGVQIQPIRGGGGYKLCCWQ